MHLRRRILILTLADVAKEAMPVVVGVIGSGRVGCGGWCGIQ